MSSLKILSSPFLQYCTISIDQEPAGGLRDQISSTLIVLLSFFQSILAIVRDLNNLDKNYELNYILCLPVQRAQAGFEHILPLPRLPQ